MGNNASTFGRARSNERPTVNFDEETSNNLITPAHESGIRERESSSGSSPRKRNRFSSLRNPFRAKPATEHTYADQPVSTSARALRDMGTRRRSTRPPQETSRRHSYGLEQHNLAGPILNPTENYSETHQVDTIVVADVNQHEDESNIEGPPRFDPNITAVRPVQDTLSNSSVMRQTDEAANDSDMSNDILRASHPITNGTSETLFSTATTTDQQGNSPDINIARSIEQTESSEEITSAQDDSPSEELVSPMPGEDQASMLARLLSVAAAATAASLVGHNNRHALRDAREVGLSSRTNDVGQELAPNPIRSTSSDGDLVDGSFDGFLSALQSGRLAQALRHGERTTDERPADDLVQQPLNFFRMFRFSQPIAATSHSESTTSDNPNTDVRMIPIIIVGIRSVPVRDATSPIRDTMPSFLGALQSLGQQQTPGEAPPTSTLSNEDHDPVNDIGITHSQPVTMTESTASDLGVNRSDMTQIQPGRVGSGGSSDIGVFRDPVDRDDASTPASSISTTHDQSTSHASTNVAESSRSAPGGIMDAVLDRLRSFGSESASQPSAAESVRRRRRRSAWRPFSANDRSEVEGESDTQSGARQANSSSFLVYVLGGSYPENHPILTTPSLFTDTPSYEDMLLLTSLIGPAKPETADSNDLDNAGIVYQLQDDSQELDARCEVCLVEYESGDQCRSLTKCSHYFHKACIDEWLTTGRNNCPMCRTNTGAQMKAPEGLSGEPSSAPEGPRPQASHHAPLGPVLNV